MAALAALAPVAAPAAPACGEEPEVVGNTMIGTPCADFIPPPPRGVTTVRGEGGGDVIFGGRGNERLFGGPGDDRLFGGIGDDQLLGGEGDDRLSGGFGADSMLDGEAGNDLVRGDATIDRIESTGGGIDTLSYATGVTPGFFDRPDPPHSFPDFGLFEGFPQGQGGRGAFIDLAAGRADNGRAPDGGGFDEEVEGDFDVVIGTPFADYIVGTPVAEALYGGGGADVIIGGGGADQIDGGAEGDYCDAGSGGAATGCEFDGGQEEVEARGPGTVAAGVLAPSGGPASVYLTGSDADDVIAASLGPGAVTFTIGPGSSFDAAATVAGGCSAPVAGAVSCPSDPSDMPPEALLIAGLGGDDSIAASGVPLTTSLVVLGGEGADEVTGGAESEDALVDGPGDDTVRALGGDDAVPNNEGRDDLQAGAGEDLFISDAACDGDLLDGGPDRDNANWAQFGPAGVALDLSRRQAGLIGAAGEPSCPPGDLTVLEGLEDIEGSSQGDNLVGDAGPNQLLGRRGPDNYRAGAGDDHLLANSHRDPFPADSDPLIDCGDGFDTALIDFASVALDGPPVNCESVEERPGDSFRPPDTPPGPVPQPEAGGTPPAPPPPPPPRRPRPRADHDPPQTRIVAGPRRLLRISGARRRVWLRFRSDEPGSRFVCKVDRRRAFRCRSPRRFVLGPGRHVIRVSAIDRAGNRDRSPAIVRIRLRRR